MLVGAVIDHQVHHQLHTAFVHFGEQRVELGQRAEQRIDVAVVTDVVAVVGLRRTVDRRQPEHVNAERTQIVQTPDDAAQVTDAVTVRVGKATRIDLVDDG